METYSNFRKNSLADFHKIIQIAYSWDNDYLHKFHIYGKDYGVSYPGGIYFSDDAHKIYIEDFRFEEGDKITYEYNFFESWKVDIRMEKVDQAVKQTLPLCLKGNGMHNVSKYDEADATINLAKACLDAGEKATFGDILPQIEAFKATHFNQKYINRRLETEI